MGCSWLNEHIAKNPSTPEHVKESIIEELPKIIEEKSKEFDNMSNHPCYFNNIFRAMAENPNNSDEIFEKLYDIKDSFGQKMNYTYYVAQNTKSAELIDKMAKDENNYLSESNQIKSQISYINIDFHFKICHNNIIYNIIRTIKVKIANQTTSLYQDSLLSDQLDYLGLYANQLEGVVNLIFKNINKPMCHILEILWEKDYGYMDMEELETITSWIENYSNINLLKAS